MPSLRSLCIARSCMSSVIVRRSPSLVESHCAPFPVRRHRPALATSSSTSPIRRAAEAVHSRSVRQFSTPSDNDRDKETVVEARDGQQDELDDLEDEFTSMMALDPEEAARAAAAASTPEETVQSLSNAPHDMTPEAAAALVERMVAAASTSTNRETVASTAPQPFSRHSLRVLCSSRAVTNSVYAAGGDRYPIEAKVAVRVDLAQLDLGRLARAAVEEIAGPRLKGDILSVTVRKYATREENLAHAYWLAGRVIAEAERAVGEYVDEDPLEEWRDVVEHLQELTAREPTDFRALVDHVAKSGVRVSCTADSRMGTVDDADPQVVAASDVMKGET